MKKLIALLLAVAMVLCLVACASKTTETSAASTSTSAAASTSTAASASAASSSAASTSASASTSAASSAAAQDWEIVVVPKDSSNPWFVRMLMLSNYASVRADYGSQYTMQAILIVVLGGVSPNGGKGRISGVITAIILLKLLESGINRFQNVSSYYISLIWGAVLILALVMPAADRKPRPGPRLQAR